MKTKKRYISLVITSCALLAAPVVKAQVAGAVHSATGAAGQAGGTAGSAVGGTASGAASSSAGASGYAQPSQIGNPDNTNPMRPFRENPADQRASADANVSGSAGADIRAPGVMANGTATLGTGLSASVDTEETVHAINAFTYDEHARLDREMDDRIKATENRISSLKNRVRSESEEEYKSAVAEAKAKEKELRQSLKEARKATQDTWTDTRAALARSYAAYAHAAAQVEASAGASMSEK